MFRNNKQNLNNFDGVVSSQAAVIAPETPVPVAKKETVDVTEPVDLRPTADVNTNTTITGQRTTRMDTVESNVRAMAAVKTPGSFFNDEPDVPEVGEDPAEPEEENGTWTLLGVTMSKIAWIGTAVGIVILVALAVKLFGK